MNISDAYAAVRAAEDEVFKAEHSLTMAVEFAQYALEDYADRPAITALLDALTAYQDAEKTRRAASDTLSVAFRNHCLPDRREEQEDTHV